MLKLYHLKGGEEEICTLWLCFTLCLDLVNLTSGLRMQTFKFSAIILKYHHAISQQFIQREMFSK